MPFVNKDGDMYTTYTDISQVDRRPWVECKVKILRRAYAHSVLFSVRNVSAPG
jgi:hypothetical protein